MYIVLLNAFLLGVWGFVFCRDFSAQSPRIVLDAFMLTSSVVAVVCALLLQKDNK